MSGHALVDARYRSAIIIAMLWEAVNALIGGWLGVKGNESWLETRTNLCCLEARKTA